MKRLNSLILTPQHKEYLPFLGGFHGGWAKGELYNYDPATSGDARSWRHRQPVRRGSRRAGIGRCDRRWTTVRATCCCIASWHFCRDFDAELRRRDPAQLNGWDYKSDPNQTDGSRNLHRSAFNWENAKQLPKVRCRTSCGRAWKNCAKCGQTSALPRTHG